MPSDLQKRAAELCHSAETEDKNIIQILLILRAFPMVRKIVEIIAHELQFKDRVSTSQLKRQVVRILGEDNNLTFALPKITSTLAELGLFEKTKTINLLTPIIYQDPQIVAWCFECLLHIFEFHPQSRSNLEAPLFLLGKRFTLDYRTVEVAQPYWEMFVSGSREQMIAVHDTNAY